MRGLVTIALTLLLAACGSVSTPTATPASVTISTVVAAWKEAGLRVNSPASGAGATQAMRDSPGLVGWYNFSAGGGDHFLLEYDTPDHAAAARERFGPTGGEYYTGTRLGTVVLLASPFAPIPTHVSVMQGMR